MFGDLVDADIPDTPGHPMGYTHDFLIKKPTRRQPTPSRLREASLNRIILFPTRHANNRNGNGQTQAPSKRKTRKTTLFRAFRRQMALWGSSGAGRTCQSGALFRAISDDLGGP